MSAAAVAQAAPDATPAVAAAALLALIGALTPDLDQAGSYLGRRTGPLPYLLRALVSNPLTWALAGWVFAGRCAKRVGPGAAFSAGRKRMRQLARHRGLSHSLLGALLATLAVAILSHFGVLAAQEHLPGLYGAAAFSTSVLPAWLTPHEATAGIITAGFAAGYLSHILLDMMTVSGVALLLPVSDRCFWALPKALRVTTR